MPTPDDREKLFQLDRMIRASGMAPLSPQELQALYRQMKAQGVTNPMAMFGEAGLINDANGQGTQRVRNQLGIAPQLQSATLPPGGGSRLYGEPNLALGDSLLSNLPGDPRNQQLVSPVLRETEAQRRRRLTPLRTL